MAQMELDFWRLVASAFLPSFFLPLLSQAIQMEMSFLPLLLLLPRIQPKASVPLPAPSISTPRLLLLALQQKAATAARNSIPAHQIHPICSNLPLLHPSCPPNLRPFSRPKQKSLNAAGS
jgi:hypothetical protein